MLLFLLVFIPLISSFLSLFFYYINHNSSRFIALTGIILTFFIEIKIWFQEYNSLLKIKDHHWTYQLLGSWIPRFGINFHMAIDSFSLIMLILTSFLGIISILSAWDNIKNNQGFFYFNLMLVLTGSIGVFMSIDLFLFFFFWEMMLIPMYFLISLWGNTTEDKQYRVIVANKFIIYMQLASLIMLLSILGLVLKHYHNTHILTFDYNSLINTSMSFSLEYILMLGFFIAFAVKTPIFPFHGWLADVYAYSPTCGSVDIVGMLLKTAPYALLRYNFVLFPNATKSFSLIAIFLGMFSLFYGSLAAFSQNNIKRFIAYSSISHMGLIIIAIYSLNTIALQGFIIQILSSSISTAALCVLSGQLYNFIGTQKISNMGGLWKNIYWIPAFTLFFSLSNLGIPGTGNFIGEFLILLGLFQNYPKVSIFVTTSIVLSAIYSLNMIQKIYFGESKINTRTFVIDQRELGLILLLMFVLLFLGLYPQILLKMININTYNI